MTSWRAGSLAFLFLACSSSATKAPDGGSSPDGPGAEAAVGPDAPGGTDVVQELGPPDVGPESGVDLLGAEAMTPGEAGMCMAGDPYGPIAACTPANTQGCDPVCQTKCGCGERCAMDSGMPTCKKQSGPFVGSGGTCQTSQDLCQPGFLCLRESADVDACGAHCYRHCRADADCPGGAKCATEVQFPSGAGTKVCSSPPEACDPFVGRCTNTGQRPFPLFGCYVMSKTETNLTSCECAGTKPVGAACMFEHECVPGAECFFLQGAGLCRKVCSTELVVGPNPGPCPANQICTPFPGSAKYGYCR
jgi:hypothetical protein